MKNYIVKFKNELKNIQSTRRETIKKGEKELVIFKRLIDRDENLCEEYSLIELLDQLSIIKTFYAVEETIYGLLSKKKKKDKNKITDILEAMYDNFLNFINTIKREYNITQSIINAFENDKIKEPINNIIYLIQHLGITTLNIEEVNKLFGMSIYFDNEYSKKYKNHQIEYMDIISELADYYNLDGSFKYNENIDKFVFIIDLLKMYSSQEPRLFTEPFKPFETTYLNNLVDLLDENNKELIKSNKEETEEKEELVIKSNISLKSREALNELRKYYKNGSIIRIPEDIEEFSNILDDCGLDSKEKSYILKLINEKINNNKNKTILSYLTYNDREIYEKSINLLNSSIYLNGDEFVIKQFIEELDTISTMLENETDEDNKKYLLNDVPSIMRELSIICNRNINEEKLSDNNLIFLINKNNIPYLCEDIGTIDSSYKKSIYSLIAKINKNNQSQFQKVLSRETLSYNMYEVLSSKCHVAFVEIDSGIYVVMGTNTAGNGYKELVNRLKANTLVLKEIENIVKNPNTRNQILEENEKYLALFSKENNEVRRLLKEHK